MLDGMVLREASPADLPAMMDVQHAGAARALAHIFPQDIHPFPRAELTSRWAAEIANPDVDVFVIEHEEGHVAGFAALRDGELLHFGTAVETWGSGLATVAHDELLERIAAKGATRARLRVLEANHRAIRFYEKLGWRRTERVTQVRVRAVSRARGVRARLWVGPAPSFR